MKDALYGENGYEKYIQQTIPDATVRLIETAELEALGCNSSECKVTGVSEWVYNTSYWTQSATSKKNVWGVYWDGDFFYNMYFDNNFGVRPVITITK